MDRWLGAMSARFDDVALRPFDAATPDRPEPWPALRTWCLYGLGSGTRPLLNPGALPAVPVRLALAAYAGPGLPEATTQAAALALQLDGTRLLQQGGAVAGVGLRLRVKAQDLMWWRSRMPHDPWDTGYVPAEPAAWQAFVRFRPRRATLVVMPALPAEVVQRCLHALVARSTGFAHPVRVLVLGSATDAKLGAIAHLAPPDKAYMPA